VMGFYRSNPTLGGQRSARCRLPSRRTSDEFQQLRGPASAETSSSPGRYGRARWNGQATVVQSRPTSTAALPPWTQEPILSSAAWSCRRRWEPNKSHDFAPAFANEKLSERRERAVALGSA